MNKLTSMADFYNRVKQDERYKKVAILAYKEGNWSTGDITYESSIEWIEKWLKDNSKRFDYGAYTCIAMVDYLNRIMDKMPIFRSKLMSPHSINTFTNKDTHLTTTT